MCTLSNGFLLKSFIPLFLNVPRGTFKNNGMNDHKTKAKQEIECVYRTYKTP
jgi:hypothetical protein